ncbi:MULTISPECIES: transposase [unclassified Paenibacillus]|uniref:transposase n=1 Tax=unclassified Paenibacillus TaxID=185978 RepID=UPI0036377887
MRKQLREGLSPKERRGLMHDRFILLKRHKKLTEMDKITLDLWTKNHPSLGIAYDLKESYFDIWDCDTRQKAFLKNITIGKPRYRSNYNPLLSLLQRLWQTGKKRYSPTLTTASQTLIRSL